MGFLSKVKTIVGDVVAAQSGFELVDIEVLDQKGILLLKVLIDTPKGVLLDECVKINKLIGYRFEEEGVLDSKYKIEVCSPGMDRLLKTSLDFNRVCGKLINVVTIEPGVQEQTFVGMLKTADDHKIIIELSKDNEVQIKLDNIKQARLGIRW